jgi:hypothetical protein
MLSQRKEVHRGLNRGNVDVTRAMIDSARAGAEAHESAKWTGCAGTGRRARSAILCAA